MIVDRPLRAMWLLNHTTARAFEVAMLKRVGIQELFLPKRFPHDASCRSASVDWSQDAGLTIPPTDLAVLNAADWYGAPGAQAWAVANKHFDVLFFVLHNVELLADIARNFKGIALWRAYGLAGRDTYSGMLDSIIAGGKAHVRKMGPRFLWAPAYPHLGEVEDEFLRDREVSLPLGMANADIEDRWTGTDRRILFVCPDIAVNDYYRGIYDRFSQDFCGLPYAIAGAQALSVRDPNVLGFLPHAEHDRNMRAMRVMFYQSTEPRHLHYHPLEAVRTGMPLVFMGGGLLDRLGGKGLPGRASSMREARKKVERILDGDQSFTSRVRASQARLLDAMQPDALEPSWRSGLDRVRERISQSRKRRNYLSAAARPPRIAVLLAHEYRGGTLRAAKLVAEALAYGARAAGQAAEIVFGHIDDTSAYADEDFADLPPHIVRRPFRWREADKGEAARAAIFAGSPMQVPGQCMFADDGINQFLDCDLWLLISDRVLRPLLALRPYIVLAYDYLQRRERFLTPDVNAAYIDVARRAQRVWVTTQASRQDAIQFAGIPSQSVVLLPMLAPRFPTHVPGSSLQTHRYFVWPTNKAIHKNHENAVKALQIYYREFGGQLDCRIVGPGSAEIATSTLDHLQRSWSLLSPQLQDRVAILGELPDRQYQALLSTAEFLWHPTRRDNGTFCVVEAASLGVPSLSSSYPAMREMDAAFELALAWMDSASPLDMATQLKRMETEACDRRMLLPKRERLAGVSLENAAPRYWEAARECL